MLLDQVKTDLQNATRQQDTTRVGVLRLLKTALDYKKSQTLKDLTPEEEIAVIKSEVKKRQEAIEIYEKANALDRVATEKAELEILQPYLPAQKGEEEVRQALGEVIRALGPGANRGQVIGQVIAKLGKENVDGSIVARVVNEEMNK